MTSPVRTPPFQYCHHIHHVIYIPVRSYRNLARVLKLSAYEWIAMQKWFVSFPLSLIFYYYSYSNERSSIKTAPANYLIEFVFVAICNNSYCCNKLPDFPLAHNKKNVWGKTVAKIASAVCIIKQQPLAWLGYYPTIMLCIVSPATNRRAMFYAWKSRQCVTCI